MHSLTRVLSITRPRDATLEVVECGRQLSDDIIALPRVVHDKKWPEFFFFKLLLLLVNHVLHVVCLAPLPWVEVGGHHARADHLAIANTVTIKRLSNGAGLCQSQGNTVKTCGLAPLPWAYHYLESLSCAARHPGWGTCHHRHLASGGT